MESFPSVVSHLMPEGQYDRYPIVIAAYPTLEPGKGHLKTFDCEVKLLGFRM